MPSPASPPPKLQSILKAARAQEPKEPRSLNAWFKLRHKFRQEVNGLPELSGAVCSNPDCPGQRPDNPKPIGAIANVDGRDMCRICYITGYGELP